MKSRESIGKSESDLPLNQLLSNFLCFLLVRFWRFVHMSERRKVVGVVQVWYPWSCHRGHSGDAMPYGFGPEKWVLVINGWKNPTSLISHQQKHPKTRVKWVWTWKCWVNIPNEIAIFHRDNDQQNHWVQWGTQHFQTHPYLCSHIYCPFWSFWLFWSGWLSVSQPPESLELPFLWFDRHSFFFLAHIFRFQLKAGFSGSWIIEWDDGKIFTGKPLIYIWW